VYAVTPLTVEQARKVLFEAYDIGDEQPLLRCRVNYFEAAYLALPPGGLAIVRQDMMGRQSHVWIPVAEISQVVEFKKRGKPALRFEAGGVVWQLDRVLKNRWPEVLDHLQQPATPPREIPRPDTELMPERAPAPEVTPAPTPTTTPAATPPPPVTPDSTARAVPVAERPTPLLSSPLPAPPESAPARRASPIGDLLEQLADADDQAPILRRLFNQCQTQQQADRALLAAQSLVVLDQAGPLERQQVDRYRTARLLKPAQPFSDDTWGRLLPLTQADAALMAVTEALAPALIRMTARPAKAYGLGPRSPDAEHLMFGRIFEVVKDALTLAEIEYHPLLDKKGDLLFANLAVGRRWAPTLVVGTNLLAGHTEPELAFLIARELTYLKVPHLMRVLAPSLAQQVVLMLTAVAMTDPGQPIAGDQEEAIKAQLKHLSAHMELDDFEKVGQAVRHMLSQAEPLDLTRWNGTVDRAALRAGLVLSSDVEVACKALATVLEEGDADVAAVRASLIRFAVSDAHQQIRKELGLAIADT
jgi:hypothetical protein